MVKFRSLKSQWQHIGIKVLVPHFRRLFQTIKRLLGVATIGGSSMRTIWTMKKESHNISNIEIGGKFRFKHSY